MQYCLGVVALVIVVTQIVNQCQKNHYSPSAAAVHSTQISVTCELARVQSLGFFDDIADVDWQRHQQRARTEQLYLDPNPETTPDPKRGAQWLMENVDPLFTCPNIRRVGGRGDGPKWTCDPHRLMKQPECLVYSIGSFGVYLFEDGLYNMYGKHCEIHVFDPNPDYERIGDAKNKNIHYHAWGLKGTTGSDPSEKTFFKGMKFLTIFEMMDQLGHTGRTIDIFKIDCEGCEVDTQVDWLSDTVDIRQILIETHFDLSTVKVTTFFDRFLERGFVPFSKEANTHPFARPVGCVFEWGFLRLHPNFLGK